ncbi:hypothetical protein NLX86_33400 [Streptomyces sp. A3M-1-3]|uniref:hypothetical protein n=1 Tax=Streptomyces sp. A3M-1-3 TaxID=2962044 RepID=UPI0020B8CCB9|nr:hypothetical protein [Streptomyces sp. A3M-1-3]MCP3822801.1 hypothetical protein [Streptomyces sp. A3M-1-3]
MAAVSAPADEVVPLLTRWPDLGAAAVNAPERCVISGGADSLAAATEHLRGQGWTVTPLRVSSAFHSPLMAEAYAGQPGRKVPLPTYAFDRRRYRLPARPTGCATTHAVTDVRRAVIEPPDLRCPCGAGRGPSRTARTPRRVGPATTGAGKPPTLVVNGGRRVPGAAVASRPHAVTRSEVA